VVHSTNRAASKALISLSLRGQPVSPLLAPYAAAVAMLAGPIPASIWGILAFR
jgi:hypothetical protein